MSNRDAATKCFGEIIIIYVMLFNPIISYDILKTFCCKGIKQTNKHQFKQTNKLQNVKHNKFFCRYFHLVESKHLEEEDIKCLNAI